VLGIALLALIVPATAALAAEGEQYPLVQPTSVVKTHQAAGYDPGQSLAFTGSSDTIPMVWIAAGLFVFGGALVFVARQRRSASNRT
jgi:hypothetical protein